MIKKTVEYEDFNGNECKEDLYFNLTETELIEMEVNEDSSLSDQLKVIVADKDASKIIGFVKELILNSYGVKSEDGKRFVKSDEIRADFKDSLAFNAVFMELAVDADKAAAFVNGLLPKKIQALIDTEEVQKEIANNALQDPVGARRTRKPATKSKNSK